MSNSGTLRPGQGGEGGDDTTNSDSCSERGYKNILSDGDKGPLGGYCTSRDYVSNKNRGTPRTPSRHSFGKRVDLENRGEESKEEHDFKEQQEISEAKENLERYEDETPQNDESTLEDKENIHSRYKEALSLCRNNLHSQSLSSLSCLGPQVKEVSSFLQWYITEETDHPLYAVRMFLHSLNVLENFLTEIDVIVAKRNVIKSICLLFLLRHKVAYPNLIKRFYEVDDLGKTTDIKSFVWALDNLTNKGFLEKIPPASNRHKDRRKKLEYFLKSQRLTTKPNQKKLTWYCIKPEVEKFLSDNLGKIIPLIPEDTRKKILVDDITRSNSLLKTHEGNEREQLNIIRAKNIRLNNLVRDIELAALRSGRGKLNAYDEINKRWVKLGASKKPDDRLTIAEQLLSEFSNAADTKYDPVQDRIKSPQVTNQNSAPKDNESDFEGVTLP